MRKNLLAVLCLGSVLYGDLSLGAQTISYTTPGVYTNVAPGGTALVVAKLWGAGGGDGAAASAGGGAYATRSIVISPGQTFVSVVGQRGNSSAADLGGVGSGDTQGGAPGYLGDYNGRGQGGQASSFFELTNGFYILQALAGAGGGGGGFNNNGAGGAGGQAGGADAGSTAGQPGANGFGGTGGGTAGGNYYTNATTTGFTNLNQAGGNGGDASDWSGGGGGGFGGGGGGGGGAGGNGAGGGGGGSYGDTIVNGSGTQAGNTSDSAYVSGHGGAAQDGLAVLTFASAGTLTASNVLIESADLRGVLNPNGLTSGYHFEYGTSTNYGQSTPVLTVSGSSTLVVGTTLTNLMPGTLYHFRFVITNSLGMISGLDAMFTTPAVTFSYSSAGVYTNVVPAGVSKGIFKVWGAGGGGDYVYPYSVTGGGGAYSSVTQAVQAGDTFVVVVGQRGATSTNDLGGSGSGNTTGGAPGYLGDYSNRAQGGQASSIFYLTNNLLIVKAVAGAGGGAGLGVNGGAAGSSGANGSVATGGHAGSNGSGGSGGGNGSAGSAYDSLATTTGISALNLAGGNGGNGGSWSGGGGGGYGGGGGGGGGSNGDAAGGGGGGSYGTTVITGSGSQPGNISDVNYVANAGYGGNGNSTGNDGLAVILWIPSNPPSSTLSSPTRLTDGNYRISFTNVSGAGFTALASTNLATTNWTTLGAATETAAGQFRFTDTQATNYSRRFYRISSP